LADQDFQGLLPDSLSDMNPISVKITN